MINLLPPQEKKALTAQRNMKLLIVLASIFLISLVCFALMLLSLYFYLLMQTTYQKSIFDEAKAQYETADALSVTSQISQYNTKLTSVAHFYQQQVYFSDALKTISKIPRPANVVLTSIVLDTPVAGNIKATMLGTANTRESLLQFKDALGTVTNISNVYFPPDNWTKPTDVSFSVSFIIKQTPGNVEQPK